MNNALSKNKKTKPTYVFDFDSTLVTLESLDELAKIALKGKSNRVKTLEKLQAITNLGMTGAITFDESLNRRLKLFKITKHEIEAISKQLVSHISPSIIENRDWFRANADRIFVISGGFTDYILPVIKRLGLKQDNVYANSFVYDKHSETVLGYNPSNFLCQPHGKVRQIAKLNLTRPVIVIGDGFTDYEIKRDGEADEFWAFTENINRPGVTALADKVIKQFEVSNVTE